MKRPIVIVVLVVLGIVATILLIVAIPRRPQQLNEIIGANSTNQPLVSKPTQVPPSVTPVDSTEIQDIVRLYFELLGDFDQRSDFENFNAAAAFATEKLRAEMYAFIEQSRDSVVIGEPISVTTTITSITVDQPTTADGTAKVYAFIKGSIDQLKSGVETSTPILGQVSVVQAGEYWFVDDFTVTPPFLGFK